MRFAILLAAAACLGSFAGAQEKAAAPAQAPAYTTKPELYPTTKCLVSGEELDADAKTFQVEGRTFRTCCNKCKAKVEKAPAEYLKKLDEVSMKTQLAHYPLGTCVISGEKLGGMGEPVQLMLDGTLVQLCCKNCTKKATANPGAMAQKVRDAAYKAQLATYPLQTCLVSGEKLGDDSKSVMFGTALVRFCCKDCVAKFEENPTKYLEQLHAAAKKAEPKKDAAPGKDDKGHGEHEHGKDEHGKDGEECCAAVSCCGTGAR